MIANGPRPSFYSLIVLVIGFDQLTKLWATASLLPIGSIELIPGFFNFTYVRNTGIAFGMFAHQPTLVAAFVTLLGLISIYYTRGLDWKKWEANVVGGCLIGGALGNLVDRTRIGYVVDFFDVHAGIHHWPVFNVADSFICGAVAWIVFRQLRVKN